MITSKEAAFFQRFPLRAKFVASAFAFFIAVSADAHAQNCDLSALQRLQRSQVETLEADAHAARERLVRVEGESSTTSRRSEWKHQTTFDENRALISDLEAKAKAAGGEGGPKLRFRDPPRSDGKRTYTDTGSTATVRYRSHMGDQGIMEAVEGKFLDPVKDADLFDRIKRSHLGVMDDIKKSKGYLSPDELESELKDYYQKLRRDIMARVESKVIGGKKVSGDEAKRIADAIEARMWDHGKIRFRKYRVGLEGQSFEGIATPGSTRGATATESVPDSIFRGKTMVEFKGKDTEGLLVKATVVDKPRMPVSDELVPLLHDSKCFRSITCYEELEKKIVQDVRKNFIEEEVNKYRALDTPQGQQALAERLLQRGLKIEGVSPTSPSAWKDVVSYLRANGIELNDSPQTVEKLSNFLAKNSDEFMPTGFKPQEATAMLKYFRSLHEQGVSTQPVQRTLYTRDSYSLEIPSNTKPIEIQVTFDRDIRELHLETGEMLGHFPYIEKGKGWNFQFNPSNQRFEHVVNGKIAHVYDPSSKQVFEVSRSGVQKQVPVKGLKIDQMEVAEVKVPEQVIELNDRDIARYPFLKNIRAMRSKLVASTDSINEARLREKLIPFSVDSGKSSASIHGVYWAPVVRKSKYAGTLKFVYDARLRAYIGQTRVRGVRLVYDPNNDKAYEISDDGDFKPVELE